MVKKSATDAGVTDSIGHTQAAAGVAGIIKMVQAIRHSVAPASLHINQPSQYIEWDGSAIELLTKTRQWPALTAQNGNTGSQRPRRAAVSSFGIGGTNAHVILEQVAEEQSPEQPGKTLNKKNWNFPWLLSGADESALRAQAQALLADESLGKHHPIDIAFSLATVKSALQNRAVVTSTASSRETALAALVEGEPHPDLVKGAAKGLANAIKPRLACLFSGQGSRLPTKDALEELRNSFPVFAKAFQKACDELDQYLECPLYAAIEGNGEGDGSTGLLDRTDFSQALIFAFEIAMFHLLESFGIRPDFVVGHSLGEIVAAYVAGALSLRQAAAIVTARAKLMAALPANGGMVSISATKDEVAEDLSRHQHETDSSQAAIAVVNSQNSVVVSGTVEAITAVAERFTALGRKATRLRNVYHGFHSSMMDPILDDLEKTLKPVLHGNGGRTISLISTVTGKRAEAPQLSSCEHWTRHVREPVRFADAVKELESAGASIFLEIGPSAVLSPHVPGAVATSSQVNRLLGALGQLWAQGIQIDWQAVFAGSGACAIDLPVYAFQRRRYWLNPPKPETAQRGLPDVGALEHGILFSATSIPGTAKIICSGCLSTNRQPWLRDHVIGGQILIPATVFIELGLRASCECTQTQEMMLLEELVFVTPLALSETEDEEFHVQAIVGEPQEKGGRTIDIYSRPSDAATGDEWTLHATGTLQPHVPLPSTNGDAKVNGSTKHTNARTTQVDISKAYAVLGDKGGLSYGPSFQCVRALWRPEHIDGENRAELQARIDPPQVQGQKFALHPALLDAALHASLLELSDMAGASIRLPFAIRGVQFIAPAGPGPILAQICDLGDDSRSVTLRSESTGAMVAKISEVVTRPWQPALAAGDLYRLEWTKSAATTTNGASKTVPSGQTDKVVRIQGARSGDAAVVGDAIKKEIHDAVAETLRAIQRWTSEKAYAGGRLVIVTERATQEDGTDVVAAAVWGFVRSAQAEFSGERIALVDLDGSPKSEAALLSALASKQELIALRDGLVMIPKLAKLAPTPALSQNSHSSSGLDVSGTVLVTGGTGGLGALLSRHIMHTYGAKNLLLVSRSGIRAPGAQQLYEELRSLDMGAVVRIEACDCADREQLVDLLAGNDAQGHPPISTVIHCAGVVDDALLHSQSPERLSRVLRPKVDAAWNLHELASTTAGSFILYSSYVSIVGNEGQAGYTAGNAFLDALARVRVARSLPALSLAWGPWQNEGGMASGDKLAIPSARLTNAQPLTDQQGLQLFDMALQTLPSTKGAPVLSPMLLRGPFPLVPSTSTTGSASTKKTPGRGAAATWRTKLAKSPTEQRKEILLGLLRDEVAAVLGYSEDQDILNMPFVDLGFDSVTSVTLGNKLRPLTGLRDLPLTVALNFATLQELATYLSDRLDLAQLEALETDPEAQNSTIDEDVVEAPRAAARPNGKVNGSTTNGKANGTGGHEHHDLDLNMFGGLVALHTRLSHLEQYTAAQDVLAAASVALPTFNMESDLASRAVPPYRLATGPSGQSSPASIPIILVSPFFPAFVSEGYRSSVYAPVAAELMGQRDIFELPHPEGLAVPANLETLAAVHVSTIRRYFTGPIILGGFSAGGTVAHAVASKLAEEETGPEQKVQLEGFFLIDTYLSMTGRGDPDWLNALPAEALTTRAGSLMQMIDNFDLALARMGALFRTLRDLDLRPLPAALPTLFMRAEDPSLKMPKDESIWRPKWPRADVIVDIPGSHLAVLDKRYAPVVASKLNRWASEHVEHTWMEENMCD